MKLLTIFILIIFYFYSFAQNSGDVKRNKKITNNTSGMTNSISYGDNFGADVTAIGDVNGDEINDLAVGASGYGISGGVFFYGYKWNSTEQNYISTKHQWN